MIIVFIGLGRIAQRYIRIVKKKYPDCKIYVIRYSNSNKVIHDNLDYEIVNNIYNYYDIKKIELKDLKRINPGYIFVTNAPSGRYKLIMNLLSVNAHIMCEKPIFDNFSHAKSKIISSKIKKNKKIFYCGFQLRQHPIFLKLKKIIENNQYGKLLFIKMEICEGVNKFNKYTTIKKSHYTSDKLGGGVLLAQCHEIDLIHYLVGDPKVIKSFMPKNNIIDGIKVDVLMHADLEVTRKSIKTQISLTMDMLDNSPRRSGTFYFENYIFSYNLINNTYSITKNKNLTTKYFDLKSFNRIDLFINQVNSFFKLANGKKINYCNFDNGIKSLQTIDYIRKLH